jgi:large subunit ribosomal protein L23
MAELQMHDVILRPLVTEKSVRGEAELNTYAFEVGISSNKHQIKQAVEDFFGVQVLSVRTLRQRGKAKRFGRHQGRRSDWKKAYIRLADGHSIDLYTEEG